MPMCVLKVGAPPCADRRSHTDTTAHQATARTPRHIHSHHDDHRQNCLEPVDMAAPHDANPRHELPRHTWEGNIFGTRHRRCIDYVAMDMRSTQRRTRGLWCDELQVPSDHRAIGLQVFFEPDQNRLGGHFGQKTKRSGARPSQKYATHGPCTTRCTTSQYASRRSCTLAADDAL